MQHPGVLIVRDDGVIVVPDAVPVSRGLVDAVEHLLDSLGAPRRHGEAGDGRNGTEGHGHG